MHVHNTLWSHPSSPSLIPQALTLTLPSSIKSPPSFLSFYFALLIALFNQGHPCELWNLKHSWSHAFQSTGRQPVPASMPLLLPCTVNDGMARGLDSISKSQKEPNPNQSCSSPKVLSLCFLDIGAEELFNGQLLDKT